jgi:hypothetical protein
MFLDERLWNCNAKQPVEELALRIVTSVWMRRIWTLQEGLLAKNVVFIFRDRLFQLEYLLFDIWETGNLRSVSSAALLELTSFYRKQYIEKPANIAQLGLMLRCRKSSRIDDKTLVIASLVYIDIKQLTPLEASKE